jgi:hypothetical protein
MCRLPATKYDGCTINTTPARFMVTTLELRRQYVQIQAAFMKVSNGSRDYRNAAG